MSKERYIAAKQKWAEKQKAKGVTAQAVASADRLPPGQKLTTGFPVLDLGVQPEIPLKDWTLTLDGMIDKPTTLSWDAFNALPQVEDVSDFHCVTTWSKYDCRWGGVAFTTLYELVAPQVHPLLEAEIQGLLRRARRSGLARAGAPWLRSTRGRTNARRWRRRAA